MDENPLLAKLAKLCGDITLTNNSNSDEILRLQQILATAIINDPSLPVSSSQVGEFQVGETRIGAINFGESFSISTQQLPATELQQLSSVLQRVKETPQAIDTTIRVFRRELPFISSQQKGSVPDWGRGGEIIETLGPFLNNEGAVSGLIFSASSL
ncbi:hypothetical protein [Flavitalea sp.]|nr:hypothetical protein [Flavitalea sp.]